MEYLVRAARITDIDRLVALSDGVVRRRARRSALGAGGPAAPAGLPAAGQHLRRRERGASVVGGAVLALRPSVVAGGYVGTIDLLVVDPDHDADRVTDALLEELLRSASNKGCSVVEAAQPDDPAARTRWERHGLRRQPVRASTTVAAVGAAARRALMTVAPSSAHRAGGRQPTQGVTVGKNVAVFVDVANIFYAAKAAGVDIDYVTLLEVGHRRPRPRARLRVHGARPGQREPAQLPRLPAPAATTRSSARTSASTATARSRRTSTSSSSST